MDSKFILLCAVVSYIVIDVSLAQSTQTIATGTGGQGDSSFSTATGGTHFNTQTVSTATHDATQTIPQTTGNGTGTASPPKSKTTPYSGAVRIVPGALLIVLVAQVLL